MLIKRKDSTILTDTGKGIDMNGLDLREADFNGILLEGGNFSDAILRAADFSGSELYDTYLYRADCTECSFKGALLQGVVLDEAIFSGANFEGARLLSNNMGISCSCLGADLRSTNLAAAILSDCEYDSKTLFPVGFDPAARGMVRVK